MGNLRLSLECQKSSHKSLFPDSISEFIREWSYVFVEKPSHHWYPIKIVISSQGEKIAVGDFLTEEEKKEFVSSLEEIISEYRAN